VITVVSRLREYSAASDIAAGVGPRPIRSALPGLEMAIGILPGVVVYGAINQHRRDRRPLKSGARMPK